MALHIVILAAGKGTRMRSDIPKVLHQLGGKPLIAHVIQTAQSLKPKKIHIVCGHQSTAVREQCKQYKNIKWVEQTKQLGTGHAVKQALSAIETTAQVLILYGDVPLINTSTLQQLIVDMPPNGLSILTAEFSDPRGFGRIIRDNSGAITAIIEQKEASPLQQQIKEINSGILVTTVKILKNYLPLLQQHNAQGEYYLTDIITMLYTDNVPINCLLTNNPEEVIGVNDKKQLAYLERNYQKNLAINLMTTSGLTLMDPARFDLRGDLNVGKDVIIDINVVLDGKIIIGDNSSIGPNNFLKNVSIGNNVTIKANCVIEGAVIADNCVIGPFARIRPNSYLENGAHIGNFVEIKNTKLGKNSKANHLTYLGDTTVGKEVNIGAGTITCNYDGINKYKTVIENQAFIGSNTSLVAPVKVGKGAIIGAGSVITENTPPNKLTIARAKQITIKNWRRKKK